MAGIAQFGLVIAGRPVMTDFREIGPAHYVVDILDPTQITDLTFFLLPGSPVPLGFGAVLYFAVPALQNWQLLGTVFAEKPSAIFRTSWPTHPDVVGQPVLQLGVSIENLDSVKNLGIEASGLEERKAFALKIAQDLFNYLSSFSTSNNQSYMTIPTNLLDKWMERIVTKKKNKSLDALQFISQHYGIVLVNKHVQAALCRSIPYQSYAMTTLLLQLHSGR
ncbi:unnamed protein product [Peronospora belbahrii]|uniref:Hikeshi-like domain-containing protein n=1 Tax=Peronospora belbahrii TaxID=622444 RepID=A0ABN8CRK0_9STRA|nr:unnamed protein product [Peronospora belbahrii]